LLSPSPLCRLFFFCRSAYGGAIITVARWLQMR
jgi:hypothetical protein